LRATAHTPGPFFVYDERTRYEFALVPSEFNVFTDSPPDSRSVLPASRARVLVVDDEATLREMLADFLELEGYDVTSASDGMAALDATGSKAFDVVLTDMKMPRLGGLALLERLRQQAPTTMVVMMTGFGTVETAIDAMKRGAYDYVLKPFKVEEVMHVVARAVEKRRVEADNIRLRQAVSLYKVSEALNVSLSLDQVVDTVLTTSIVELGAEFVTAWLKDPERGWFERQRRSAETHDGRALLSGVVDIDRLTHALRDGQPVLVHGEECQRFFTSESSEPATSFVAVPLTMKGNALGLLAAAVRGPIARFEEGQRKMLSILASRAAASIENARLYGDLQGTFQQTIEGLASAIDKMDRYTAGHSARVANYAMFLARRLGLSDADVDIARHSALMHDIGKIGCALNLNKPGKLTADEYEAFKLHPAYGRDILSPIKFLNPLIPGVHLHHERFDGRGYPLGLEGQTIPIIARIISVADTYDAMTSDRSYRRALPNEVAVAEIERCTGSQFDPDVSGNFLEGLDEIREALRATGEKVPD
jgi:response regulator RpfG family c-di-GMP phosphodiesterase